MAAVFVLLLSSVGGAIGWWLGGFFGFVPAIVASMVTSVLGIHYARRINRDFFGY